MCVCVRERVCVSTVRTAEEADDALAVVDRLLDAAKDDAAEREVARVVAHPVPATTTATLLTVASLQTIDDLQCITRRRRTNNPTNNILRRKCAKFDFR